MLFCRYSVAQVGAWLESVGLGQLRAEFEEQQIDGETLAASDLQGLFTAGSPSRVAHFLLI